MSGADPVDDAELAASIADLSGLVLAQADLPTTLTYIADFAVRAIPGADGAGLTLFQNERPDTVVASAPFVREADTLQYGIGEGPCITATRERRTVRSDSLGEDPDFPTFGPQAAHLGVHSTLSLPLVAADRMLGSINVYAHAPRAFDAHSARLGEVFAIPVAVSVQNALALSQAQLSAIRLRDAASVLSANSARAEARRSVAEDEAVQARGQASSAISIKDEFLSRVSHEMRTPLNAILGFAQILDLDRLSARHRDAVDHILASSRELLAMIEDVFDIAALDAGELALAQAPVALAALIEDAVAQARPTALAAGVEIVLHPDQGYRSWRLNADPARVRQVLVHLLTNAVKFNRPGGRVDVSCTVSDHPDGAQVSVAVADTGSGIAATDLPRLFAPFDRLGRTSEPAGRGVGLALSQRLITLMGGHLTVASSQGRGSTFTVTLPLAPPVDPRPQPSP